MKFSQFGIGDGRLVFYFHGAPGAPEECARFNDCAQRNGLTLICLDRFSIDPALQGGAYFQHIAASMLEIAGARRFDVIGFSIGTFVALQTCRQFSDQVGSLHLVSVAAPLDGGDFLDGMAGKPVFQLAKSYPLLLLALSYWQALIALLFPKALFRLLFASAIGADRGLAARSEFQTELIGVLRTCFLGKVRGYVRDVRLYVQPWKTTLSAVTTKTHLWHGAMDNWSPLTMADYVQAAVPGFATRTTLAGQSHYSCLHDAVPAICEQLRRDGHQSA